MYVKVLTFELSLADQSDEAYAAFVTRFADRNVQSLRQFGLLTGQRRAGNRHRAYALPLGIGQDRPHRVVGRGIDVVDPDRDGPVGIEAFDPNTGRVAGHDGRFGDRQQCLDHKGFGDGLAAPMRHDRLRAIGGMLTIQTIVAAVKVVQETVSGLAAAYATRSHRSPSVGTFVLPRAHYPRIAA